MKRIATVLTSAIVLTVLLASFASAQSDANSNSLGDYARSIRQVKSTSSPSTKKYDNDNLPVNETLSVVGPASDQNSDAKQADTQTASNGEPSPDAKPEDASKTADSKAAPTDSSKPADQAKSGGGEWKDKIADEKSQIELLSRELSVAQREAQMNAAAFYADAGNRLRDPGDWDKKATQTKEEIDQKQKALDEAKQRLEDMQEDARKAGVPSADRE